MKRIYCKCGCKQEIDISNRSPETIKSYKYRGYPNFICGHNLKGGKKSKETKEKIRLKRFERKKKLGYINSPETCKKMSKARMGNIAWNKGLTKETDERIKKSAIEQSKTSKRMFIDGKLPKFIGAKGKENPMFGNPRSDNIKKRISESLKGKKVTIKTRKKLSDARKGCERTKGSFTKESRAKLIIPRKDTSIEVKIQNFLKQLGIEFFTHQYIKKIEHGYQCDILIPLMNLVIECDGDYWHKYPIGNEIDHIRTKELIEKGFNVLRLWEFEIKIMELNDFKSKLKDYGK